MRCACFSLVNSGDCLPSAESQTHRIHSDGMMTFGPDSTAQRKPSTPDTLLDPGLPLTTLLTDHELKETMSAAVDTATSLTANQRVAAELLHDSFFNMSPEAS